MTPELFDSYLRVLEANRVSQAVVHLPDGTQFSVVRSPELPPMEGLSPTPGGWKTLQNLDNPMDLDPQDPGK